ncbi:MAG: endonuclease/exonuclease/phosphatase family protein [Acidobacteria bacterium]|nr:endonuclease/exonuclease/phosphatase family protein [Acidobacteriota bacterium]
MRRLGALLTVVVPVALMGASGQRAAVASYPAPTFRVATFNIHKGADRPGRYDLEQTIDLIAHLDADLVGVQEALRNHAGFGCDDQPALIAEGLRQRTGQPWTSVYAQSWVTEDRRCLGRGQGDDVETEGVAFFARDRILESRWVRLSEGRVGLAARVASMPDVPVIVTHLAASRQDQAGRAQELGRLLPWAAQQRPGVLLGDLNARPDADELAPVLARYRDAWAEADARGVARGVLSGSTRPGRRVSRIDYVLYSPDVPLTLQSVEIVDPATLPGLGGVSDHFPVVATFLRGVPGDTVTPVVGTR